MRAWPTSKVLAHLFLAAAPWLLSDSTFPSPSIQPSFPCLPKFFLAIGPKQFLYSLMVITAHRGDSHIRFSYQVPLSTEPPKRHTVSSFQWGSFAHLCWTGIYRYIKQSLFSVSLWHLRSLLEFMWLYLIKKNFLKKKHVYFPSKNFLKFKA